MTRRTPDRPRPRWQTATAQAATPDERLAVSYDRLRAGLSWLRRKQRDQAARRASCDEAARIAAEAADYLTGVCEQIERTEASGRGRHTAA